MPIQSSVLLPAEASVGQPPTSEPSTVPQRAMLMARPCMAGLETPQLLDRLLGAGDDHRVEAEEETGQGCAE